MTGTQLIIDLLADGKPRSVAELMALCGLPRDKVRNSIAALTNRDMADAEPVRYSLTALGAQRIGRRPLTRQERVDLCNARQKKKRSELRMAEQTEAQRNAERDALASGLRAHAPNSVFALGGVA